MVSLDIQFSVIITLYNKEAHILETLISVCNQTYKKFELIIINDGSTDDSLKIISGVLDSRIRIFNTKNQGVSNARNYGVKQAVNNYIAFLDGDDLWEKDHLKVAKDAIVKFPDESVFSSRACLQKGNKIKEYKYSVSPSKNIQVVDYFASSLNQSILNASSLVIKTSVFDELGCFNTNYTNYEDIDFWFKIGLRYQIVFSSKKTVTIRVVNNSLSRKKVNLNTCCFFKAYDTLIIKNKAFYKVLDMNRYSLALLCKENKDKKKYNKIYSKINQKNLSLIQLLFLRSPYYLVKKIKSLTF